MYASCLAPPYWCSTRPQDRESWGPLLRLVFPCQLSNQDPPHTRTQKPAWSRGSLVETLFPCDSRLCLKAILCVCEREICVCTHTYTSLICRRLSISYENYSLELKCCNRFENDMHIITANCVWMRFEWKLQNPIKSRKSQSVYV